MNCQFLDNLTLGSLTAPIAEEEFRTRYWEQQPLIIHREDPTYYGDLFTLQDFDEAITRDPNYVKIANAATSKNKSYKVSMATGLEAVLADMRDGGTLVLDQLHRREPKLALLCRLLGQQLGHNFQTNLYLTPPHGKGFTPHWDNHDVFVLQVVGSKRWQIERERRVFPKKGDTMGDDGRELRGDLYSFTLKQGDMIYIPRGFVHAAECGSEPSLHITLGLTGVFLEELLHSMVRAAVQRNEGLRVALPLGFMRGSTERIISDAMVAFREIADEAFLKSVMDQYRDELVSRSPLDIEGQVLDFFQPSPLSAVDVVGPRRGIVYQTHVVDDSVRLNFGARSIVFLGLFREALEFALSTPTFIIRELPGELIDEEKIVFIERLMQEGLVVRK